MWLVIMSSDIVIYHKNYPESIDTDVLDVRVTEWTNRMSSGGELFSSLMNSEEQELLNNLAYADTDNGTLGAAAGTTVSMAGMSTPVIYLAATGGETVQLVMNNFLLFGAAGGLAAGIAVGTTLWALVRRSRQKEKDTYSVLLGKLDKYSYVALQCWLSSRYGLAAVPPHYVLKMLDGVRAVNKGQDSKDVEFSDDGHPGRLWKFSYSGNNSWFVEEAKTVEAKEASVALAAAKPETVSLPGECALLMESFMNWQAKLAKLNLPTESQHAFLRRGEDVRQAVSTYEKLVELDDAESIAEGEQHLAEVLTVLNEEARGMVSAVAAGLNDEFRVQKDYLRSRQLVEGVIPSALMLEAKTNDVEKEMNQHVN
jgi:hypothetical protein